MPPGYYTLFVPALLRKETRNLSPVRRASWIALARPAARDPRAGGHGPVAL